MNNHTGDEPIPTSVHMEHMLNTGRKSNVSRTSFGSGREGSLGLDTPNILMASHINISQRRSNQVTSHATQQSLGRAIRPSSLNMSHISSSSSSGFMDDEEAFDDSLNPIRASLENSFAETNLSPIRLDRGRKQSNEYQFQKSASKSPTRMRSLSPKPSSSTGMETSPVRSPVRSPLGNISPNRSRSLSVDFLQKKALSPHGTFSLKEAEGTRMSMPDLSTTTNKQYGSSSSSSSNMSVGSGSETMSVPASFSASRPVQSKLVLPSLSSSRRDLVMVETQPKPVEELESVVLSPEKELSKVRSPEPTPNSQRRIIKRLRASIPSAKYLMPEDMVYEEEPVKINTRGDQPRTTGDVSSEARTEPIRDEEAIPASYENTFVFPSESIPFPNSDTLRLFHDQAIAIGSPSHQFQLNRAKTNILSFQEVILPSIAYEMNAVLKQMQAKAQRNVRDGLPASEGSEVVKAIETCRIVVTKCTSEAMKVAGAAWREREKKQRQLRQESIQKQEKQRRLDELAARKERKEARARSRQERYERQKLEKQRNHPRNKENWQEVAKLMVEIQKLEKEERLWNEALVEVKQLEEYHQPPEMIDLDIIVQGEDNGDLRASDPESIANTLVGDMTLATERINWVLKSVSLAMAESDKLRREAYDKYQDDGHKFFGYPMVEDPKALFKSLAMGSPF